MIVLALGSNRPGRWGGSKETVRQAIATFDASSLINVVAQSSLYKTAGIGPGRPEDFINAVIVSESHLPPKALLRHLKQTERLAGCRSAMRWGPRSLDLDIIDYHGLVSGWGKLNPKDQDRYALPGKLVLPHPLMHERAFVLDPLREIHPQWRHPVFFKSVCELSSIHRHTRAGRILEKLD